MYRTFCAVEDAGECIVRVIEHPDKSCGHTFNVGNPNNNIQVKALADLMIKLYSKLTGKEAMWGNTGGIGSGCDWSNTLPSASLPT